MLRRTRRRFEIALLVILCLLFQQAALAAYLCPIERMPANAAEMTAHCAEMGLTQTGLTQTGLTQTGMTQTGMTQAQDNPVLCEKHCNPDHTLATDAAKLSVPPLALPAALPLPIAVRAATGMPPVEPPTSHPGPPPRLRFCSLLI